jgi:hypothetical protein
MKVSPASRPIPKMECTRKSQMVIIYHTGRIGKFVVEVS